MRPTRKVLEKKLRNNAMDAIALRFALRDKLDVIDVCRNDVPEISDHRGIYNLEDMNELRGLLIRLIYESLNRKNLEKAERKIKKMIRPVLYAEKAKVSLCPYYWLYLTFLHSLESLITKGLLCFLRNSVTHIRFRELSELSEPAELAD